MLQSKTRRTSTNPNSKLIVSSLFPGRKLNQDYLYFIPQPGLQLSFWVCQKCNGLSPTPDWGLPFCRAHWGGSEQWPHIVHPALCPSQHLCTKQTRGNCHQAQRWTLHGWILTALLTLVTELNTKWDICAFTTDWLYVDKILLIPGTFTLTWALTQLWASTLKRNHLKDFLLDFKLSTHRTVCCRNTPGSALSEQNSTIPSVLLNTTPIFQILQGDFSAIPLS